MEEVECDCRKCFDNTNCIPARASLITSAARAAPREGSQAVHTSPPGTYYPAHLCVMIDTPLVRVGLIRLGFNPIECVNSPVAVP